MLSDLAFSDTKQIILMSSSNPPVSFEVGSWVWIQDDEHCFLPAQVSGIPLAKGDVIYVSEIWPDGWFYGQNISNGEAGLFPGNFVVPAVTDGVIEGDAVERPLRDIPHKKD